MVWCFVSKIEEKSQQFIITPSSSIFSRFLVPSFVSEKDSKIKQNDLHHTTLLIHSYYSACRLIAIYRHSVINKITPGFCNNTMVNFLHFLREKLNKRPSSSCIHHILDHVHSTDNPILENMAQSQLTNTEKISENTPIVQLLTATMDDLKLNSQSKVELLPILPVLGSDRSAGVDLIRYTFFLTYSNCILFLLVVVF